MAPTYQTDNITHFRTDNDTLIPIPIFGLQNAMTRTFDFASQSSTNSSLFPDACVQPNGGHNCTASCLDPKQIFASLDTLHNCVEWPSLIVGDETDKLAPSAADLAKSLGFAKNNSPLPSQISNRIQSCLLASCANDENCNKTANQQFPPGGFRKHVFANLTGDLYYGMNTSIPYFNPCHYISAPVTADVAGVGVFISYAMQMGLVLIAFILAVPWKKMIRGSHHTILVLWHKLQATKASSGTSERPMVAKADRREYDQPNSKHTMRFDPASAIVPAVVEFQKAQCYFMLATNIASLVVQDNGGLAPETFQSLYNTYIFIKVIAIGGYLPITFGLMILRMIDKVGWYVLGLSAASIGVAIANLYNEKTFNPSLDDLTHLQSQSVTGGPSECAENNPIAWCLYTMGVNNYGFQAQNSGDGANDILSFCLVTFGLLLVEHFWNSKDHTNRNIRNLIFKPCVRGSEVNENSRTNKIVRWIWRYLAPLLFTIFLLVHLYCFAVFANDLNWFNDNNIYDDVWGFGQIVAILVWAPPIFEYLWQMFRGIEEGSDHRLPNDFEVRKKPISARDESDVNLMSHDAGKTA